MYDRVLTLYILNFINYMNLKNLLQMHSICIISYEIKNVISYEIKNWIM